MNSGDFAEFALSPGDYGWSAPLPPGSPTLFGLPITVDIHTRTIPSQPESLPPISTAQAALVRSLLPHLVPIMRRVEAALTAYHERSESEFISTLRDPHIWLDAERDDGISWTLVIGRTDWPDFGYHVEFKGKEFVEIWAGS
jgi:hypothetical protein